MHYGIDRGKMLKIAKDSQHSLILLGNLNADFNNVVLQASKFVASSFGVDGDDMTEARFAAWCS